MNRSKGTFWTTALTILGLIAVGSLFYYFYVWNTYYDSLPARPDERTGRVYADNFHGFVRYESRAERARLERLEDLSLALVVLAILAGAGHEWWARRSRDGGSGHSPAPAGRRQ